MQVQFLIRPVLPRIAYVHSRASGAGAEFPPVIFLGGYRSDMSGTKATYLEQQCRARGQEFTRFDYSGHGLSEGKFSEGTIGAWKKDALSIVDKFAEKPVVLVGSSMGGWIMLLAALARPGRIRGLVGIAAAPDFTEDIYEGLTSAQKAAFDKTGRISADNDYSDEPYEFTKVFYEEAKSHMVLDRPQKFDFPVRLIQGKLDNDVKWDTALKIRKNFVSPDFDIVFVEDGDHRLSRPQDLELIDRAVREISGAI